jgi:membrane protease YdiL (CAAX protease family)
LTVILALGFALGRTSWCRLCGPASALLFPLQEHPVGKSICLCTAALWLSDRLRRSRFVARLTPLAAVLLAGALDPRLLAWTAFKCNAAFLAAVAGVACAVLADSLVRIRRSGSRGLIREYAQGALTLLTLSVLGATSEEVLFRGVLLSTLTSAVPIPLAVLFSSALFGLFHLIKGRPSGWAGVHETFVLGMLLGLLVFFTGGVAAGILVHGIGIPYLFRTACSIRSTTMEKSV